MALQHHKFDLGTVGCERFLVSVDVPKDHQANETIRALLDERNEAWDRYSRNRVQHSVLLTASEREESFQYACEWLVVPMSFPRVPDRRPDATWSAALSEMYDMSVEQGGWHAHGDFSRDPTVRPKLALPLTLFASGAFPFNKVIGYRAARVEDDQEIWSVIIDGADEEEGYRVSIHIHEYPLARDGSYRDIVARCVSIRDDVMIGRAE